MSRTGTYRTVRVPLTAILERRELVPPNVGIVQVSVEDVPAGSDVNLMFGQDGEPVLATVAQKQWTFCPPLIDGLYAEVPSVGFGELVLMVSFGGVEAST